MSDIDNGWGKKSYSENNVVFSEKKLHQFRKIINISRKNL